MNQLLIAQARVKEKGQPDSAAWIEDFKFVPGEDPAVAMRCIIDKFNKTLQPGEKPREFVCLFGETRMSESHIWKKDCLVTQFG